jgi:FkbM family methyltransferase
MRTSEVGPLSRFDAALAIRSRWDRARASATDRARLLARHSFQRVGLDVHELGAVGRSLPLVLDRIRQTSWYPRTLIDVGVAYGTSELYDAFPEAFVLLIEPIQEWQTLLLRVLKDRPHEFVPVACWDSETSLEMGVHHDPAASSLYEYARLVEPSTTVSVDAKRLDTIVSERTLSAPLLLKVDVQGAELRVLRGTTAILEAVEVVIVEATLRHAFVEGPLIDDLCAWAGENGYRMFDIFGGHASERGRVLEQVDLAFVREGTAVGTALLGESGVQ